MRRRSSPVTESKRFFEEALELSDRTCLCPQKIAALYRVIEGYQFHPEPGRFRRYISVFIKL